MEYPIQPIEPSDIAKLQHLDRATLQEQLKLFIFDLLQHDFERLCALMYRHDVNEALFNKALMLATDAERAEAIAGLVIDREMLKIKTRERFSKNSQK